MNTDIMTIKEIAEYLKLTEKTATVSSLKARYRASRSADRGGSGAARSKVG